MLSNQAFLEFKEIYKKNFGEDLPENIARERAMSFLEFFKIVFKPLPIPEKNYEKK
jgi:hypothetical protein